MKRSKLFTIAGSLCLMFVIAALPIMAACAAPEPTPTPTPTPTPAKVIELSHSSPWALDHPFPKNNFIPIFEEVEKRSNGRVNINFYWTSSLVGPRETYEGVATGMADTAALLPGVYAGRFPLGDVQGLPLMYKSPSVGARTTAQLYKEFPCFVEEVGEVRILAINTTAEITIHSLMPIRTLEDLKGKKIGGETPLGLEILKMLGATPVDLIRLDWYPAFQKGTLDGGFGGWPTCVAYHEDEFYTFHVDQGFSLVATLQVMSPDTYNSLPEDIQKIFDDVFKRGDCLSGAVCDWNMNNIKDEFAEWSEIYTLPPDEMARWAEKCAPLDQKWVKTITDAGHPGQKIYDRVAELAKKYATEPIKAEEWWPQVIRDWCATSQGLEGE